MFAGKTKAVTFSYDDGVTQDIRLIEILDRYGLKCTFNLNSGLLGKPGALVREGVCVPHNKVQPSEVARIYKNHEVAAHTLTHPALTKCSDEEVIRQVEEDRLALSELCGCEVRGMAYPGAGATLYDDRVAGLIRERTGIKYARITEESCRFEPQTDLYVFRPTIHHHNEFEKLNALAEEFIALKPDSPKLFYIWGHSYEFDIHDDWDRFEDFCRRISGKDDIFYGTNSEVLLGKQQVVSSRQIKQTDKTGRNEHERHSAGHGEEERRKSSIYHRRPR